MALIKFGGLAVDARGSMAGLVFSRNASGNYVRARVKPVNPQSARQTAARTGMSFISQLWRSGTTQAQKDAWAQFGSNVPAKNKLGDDIRLSGFTQFMKSNMVAKNASLEEVIDGPVIYTLPGEDPLFEATIDAGTEKISIVFDDQRDWLDEDEAAMVVQMGLPQDDSIGFFAGPWRHAGVLLGDSVTPLTTPDSNIDVPFEVADGQKVWTRAKIIRADGRVSDWFQFDSIVATV